MSLKEDLMILLTMPTGPKHDDIGEDMGGDDMTSTGLLAAYRQRIRPKVRDFVADAVWGAYNVGVLRDGKWMDCAMSEAEWLQREMGLEPGWHDDVELRTRIQPLIDRLTDEALA